MGTGRQGWRWVALAWLAVAGRAWSAPTEAELAQAVRGYFAGLFQRMERVAGKAPTEESFREVLRAEFKDVPGLFGASLIDGDWTIRQVLHRRDALAVGYSLKDVKELDAFRKAMAEHPGPQLSEPAHGGLLQPRLISLRQPILENGNMVRMVSVLMRTEAFLEATGLDRCKAYAISCQGKVAEREGKLSDARRNLTVELPATTWTIEFE